MPVKDKNNLKGKQMSSLISKIRICLDNDGNVFYWPFLRDIEDLGDVAMRPAEALHLITAKKVPFEIACCDPEDKRIHNYESESCQLKRI